MDFAIEGGVEPGLVSPSVPWGHMRIWCNGVPLGDIGNPHCALPYPALRNAKEHLDKLWDDGFRGLDDEDVWNFLDGLLYGYHGEIEINDDRTLDELMADARRYGKF